MRDRLLTSYEYPGINIFQTNEPDLGREEEDEEGQSGRIIPEFNLPEMSIDFLALHRYINVGLEPIVGSQGG